MSSVGWLNIFLVFARRKINLKNIAFSLSHLIHTNAIRWEIKSHQDPHPLWEAVGFYRAEQSSMEITSIENGIFFN